VSSRVPDAVQRPCAAPQSRDPLVPIDGPRMLRTTPQVRRAAQHPGNAVAGFETCAIIPRKY
jgi:hypothetical protein